MSRAVQEGCIASCVRYFLLPDRTHKCTDHNYGIMIRDLCYCRYLLDPHILTATEIGQQIEYLCTI